MNRLASHALRALLPVALAGCALGDAGDVAGPPNGGNVGFGGAQDIGQFRKILQEGGIPGPGTLDANGFFAEHYVPLPPADCGQDLCLQSMLAVGQSWLDGSYQAVLAVALNTPVDPATIERKPLDLVVVVDTSGSMSLDDRIGYARQGLHLLVDALQDGDRMALVTYSSVASVRAPFTDPTDGALDREALHASIDDLNASGATNIYDGLQTGFDLALSAQDPERHVRVILLSDGLATEGIRDDASIIRMAEDYIGSAIGLTTIGVGTDFNVELMRGLAERGAGNFYFLEDAAAIEEVFTEELNYFVTPLAMSVTVEVRTSPAYALGPVAGTRLWRTEGNVGSMYMPAVFLASRTSTDPGDGGRRGGGSTLFIPMIPTGNGMQDPGQVADVRMRYRLPGEDDHREQAIQVRNPADPGITPEEAYYSHQAMRKQHAMYNLYLGLLAAAQMADQGNYHCALATLEDLDGRAEAWNAALGDEDIAADRALIALFVGNLRENGAVRPPEGTTCSSDGSYEPGYPDYDYDDDVYYGGFGCRIGAGGNTGAGSALIWLVAICGLVVGRRRMQR